VLGSYHRSPPVFYLNGFNILDGWWAEGALGNRVPEHPMAKLADNDDNRRALAARTGGRQGRYLLRVDVSRNHLGIMHLWNRIMGHNLVAISLDYLDADIFEDLRQRLKDSGIRAKLLTVGASTVASATGGQYNKFLHDGIMEKVLGGLHECDPDTYEIHLIILSELRDNS